MPDNSLRAHAPVARNAAHASFPAALLRSWKLLLFVAPIIGFGAVAGVSLLLPRMYSSSATFMPQSGDSPVSGGLAVAAREFGVQLPSTGSSWGLAVYAELLGSSSLLTPLAQEVIQVAEEGRSARVVDLLQIPVGSEEARLEAAVRKLRGIVRVVEDKRMNAIRLKATTRWPSVSLAITKHLLHAVNRFNVESRGSQASAERKFAEARANEAQQALREAEGRLESFLEKNRSLSNSPSLTVARERFQREIALRQQILTTLVQSREEARIREVRDTPLITVLEAPRLPATGEPRGTLTKGVLGAVAALLVVIAFAYASENWAALSARGAQVSRDRAAAVERAVDARS